MRTRAPSRSSVRTACSRTGTTPGEAEGVRQPGTAGQLPHPRGDVVRRAEGEVGAEGERPLARGRHRVDCDDRRRPGQPQQLHGVRVEAADAPDADRLTGPDARGPHDRGPRRGDRVRHDAGLLQRHPVRQRHERADRGQRVLGPAPVVVDTPGVHPAVLPLAGLQQHPLPHGRTGHPVPQLGDGAGHLVAEGHRVAGEEQRAELPFDQVDVGQADAGGGHPDQHLAGARGGLGHLLDREVAGAHVQPSGEHRLGHDPFLPAPRRE
jgi:hypothetical protein